MSFIRPEAAGVVRRWGEPVVAGGLVVLTGWLGIRWAGQGGGFGWIALFAAFARFWPTRCGGL